MLERGSEAPVPGFTVELRRGGQVVASDVSDAGGRFRLAVGAASGGLVQVLAREGWVVPEALPAPAPGAPPAPLLFHVARRLVLPIAGRLVDEDTGEALPDYRFRVRTPSSGGPEEWLVTDSVGRFQTAAPFPLSLIHI